MMDITGLIWFVVGLLFGGMLVGWFCKIKQNSRLKEDVDQVTSRLNAMAFVGVAPYGLALVSSSLVLHGTNFGKAIFARFNDEALRPARNHFKELLSKWFRCVDLSCEGRGLFSSDTMELYRTLSELASAGFPVEPQARYWCNGISVVVGIREQMDVVAGHLRSRDFGRADCSQALLESVCRVALADSVNGEPLHVWWEQYGEEAVAQMRAEVCDLGTPAT